VLPDVGTGLHRVLLECPVDRRLELLQEHTVGVGGQEVVPLRPPDHLDHVPTRPSEHAFELLHDLAVAPHRPVEALEIAVDDEGEIVELLGGGQGQGGERLGLVALAVAQEPPDPGLRRVGDAAVKGGSG
jgi:hypothetical protein